MESFSVGKMNFRSKGKSCISEQRGPRHSAGISGQASCNVFVANAPFAIGHWTSVSQTSPILSERFVFSGKIGASERSPQILG